MNTLHYNVYSRLIYKTTFSFTSSNSSFSECLRKDILSTSLSSFNSACTTDCRNINFETQTKALSSAASYSFNNCSWSGCLSEPAGAISCSTSGVSLIITGCIFLHCYSTSGKTASKTYNGGAICLNGINSLIASSSSFIQCSALQTNHDNGGSGGIFAYNIKTTISLSYLSFVSCFTGTSAAGAYFESIKASTVGPETVNNCRFVDCKAEGKTPDGGGLTFRNPAYTMGCSNTLFCKCNATTNAGGGLDFTFNKSTDSYPIRFCFFKDNAAVYGKDIRLRSCSSNQQNPLLHCFSQTESDRVYDWSNKKDRTTWLPQGSIHFVHSPGNGSKAILHSPSPIPALSPLPQLLTPLTHSMASSAQVSQIRHHSLSLLLILPLLIVCERKCLLLLNHPFHLYSLTPIVKRLRMKDAHSQELLVPRSQL